uniref:Uncharacterized protein n=1 Tax=Xiphophorus maculatus TaxID=8083 RepID=A0A3B5RAS7_XIPMA
MCGSNTRVMAAHLRLWRDRKSSQTGSLAIVHPHHGAHHLRQDHHVPQVGLHHLWFLHRRSLLLSLAQALEEGLVLAAQAPVQPPPLAGAVQLHQLLTVQTTHTAGVRHFSKYTLKHRYVGTWLFRALICRNTIYNTIYFKLHPQSALAKAKTKPLYATLSDILRNNFQLQLEQNSSQVRRCNQVPQPST